MNRKCGARIICLTNVNETATPLLHRVNCLLLLYNYTSLSFPPLPLSPPPGRIPQFGYKDEVNVDRLVELRSLLKTRLSERGVAFSYMPVLIKAVSLALTHHPILNSTVDPDCTTITYRADHNVGVAMDTPMGLIVPNVKRVQVMTLSLGVCMFWLYYYDTLVLGALLSHLVFTLLRFNYIIPTLLQTNLLGLLC